MQHPCKRRYRPQIFSIFDSMDFKDPFDGYRLTQYPSSASSVLSSAPNSPLQWKDLKPDVERILREYTPTQQEDDTADVLNAFLKYLCKDAQTTLMGEIKQLGGKPDELRQLRDFLLSSILTPMVMAGGKQPSLTPTPIQEAGLAIELMMMRIEPSSRNEQAVLKEQCLSRDNQRCVFTEMVDRKYCEGLTPERRKDLKICNTQCAHILPFALRKFDPESAFETGVKAQIWWALYRYFPFIAGKIGPESINAPGNAITLWTEAHVDFGAMRIAAEPRSEAHEYRLHTMDANYLMGEFVKKKSTITLTQSDPAVQMPDPDFLRLHYQVSKILETRPNVKLVFAKPQ